MRNVRLYIVHTHGESVLNVECMCLNTLIRHVSQSGFAAGKIRQFISRFPRCTIKSFGCDRYGIHWHFSTLAFSTAMCFFQHFFRSFFCILNPQSTCIWMVNYIGWWNVYFHVFTSFKNNNNCCIFVWMRAFVMLLNTKRKCRVWHVIVFQS